MILVERQELVGGNAGSFDHEGHRLDYGSHRLHRASDAEILDDIRRFLGPDLLDRPRHGRIRLLGRWVHFPLKPLDLVTNLDKSFALGSARDLATRWLRGGDQEDETFASVLEEKLGRTICTHFYFPYARKIWGHDPDELSAIQARRRVSASTGGKMLRKILGQVPGFKKPGAGRFYYPRRGFGQISEAYADQARDLGADLWLGWTVSALRRDEGDGRWMVSASRGEETRDVEADHVWSTLPITTLARLLQPSPPDSLLQKTELIRYRAMILIYLELGEARFSDYDAHYFPGEDVAITRMSEPKNYAARTEPADSTVLCAELPCAAGDEHWEMSDEALGELVARDLEQAGLPLPSAPRRVFTRRLPQAYPIYSAGYEDALRPLDDWLAGIPELLTYGRQGLFAHDNTHHALYMAYAAADCLVDGQFDDDRWADYREVFATHVVED